MTLRYRIRQWLRDYLGTGEAAERRSSIMFSQLNECATRKQLSAILAVLKEQNQALLDRQQVMVDELVKMNGTLTAAHVMQRQPTVKEFAPDWDGAQLMALHELLSNPEKEN